MKIHELIMVIGQYLEENQNRESNEHPYFDSEVRQPIKALYESIKEWKE